MRDRVDPSARDWRLLTVWLLIGAVFVWLVFVASAMAYRGGLFDWDRGLGSEDIGSAVWGFLGTGVAVLGALVAALFTYSYNVRTLQLATEAENRARNEAAATLLGLLKADGKSGKGPVAAQIVGVVIGLRDLKMPEVADGVLEASIENGDLTPGTIVHLLAENLADDEARQTEGARLLMSASLTSLTEESTRTYAWPKFLNHWPLPFEESAKQYILIAVGRTLATQDLNFWKGQRDWAAFLLHDALEDSIDSVKKGAWLLLRTLSEALEGPTTFKRGGKSLSREDLKNALSPPPAGDWNTAVRIADEKIREKWGLPENPTYAWLSTDGED